MLLDVAEAKCWYFWFFVSETSTINTFSERAKQLKAIFSPKLRSCIRLREENFISFCSMELRY